MQMREPATRYSERRISRRYGLHLPVRIFGSEHNSYGQTLELSSHAVVFEGVLPLRHGEHIQLEIEWPLKLQSVCPVFLGVQGTVVRAEARRTVVRIGRYGLELSGAYSAAAAIESGLV